MESEENKNCLTDDTYPAGSTKSNETISTVRLQRNQAEKQRRDRLNGYISELANIVPMVRNSSKPVDKVSVLRLAAAHMRLNLSCLNPKKFNSNIAALPDSIDALLEPVQKSINGFLVVTTFTGLVLFCSQHIEDFVGYQSIDIIGQSIFKYVDTKEITFFKKLVKSVISKKKNIPKVVKLHMQQRPLPRSNEIRYRKMLFKISVHFNKPLDSEPQTSLQKTKTVNHKDFGGASIVLMFVEPLQLESKINHSYLLTHQDIYFTIHGLQGEIMYADQRIATITGYMPQDVKGTSAYQYILDNDVPIALFAQNAMFTSDDGTGLITYRLKIFDSSYIFLQSKGRIVYKDNSAEKSHFVCYNRWLSEEEGGKELKKFQERFAPQIINSKLSDIVQAVSTPQSPPSKALQKTNKDANSNFEAHNDPQIIERTSLLTSSEINKCNHPKIFILRSNSDCKVPIMSHDKSFLKNSTETCLSGSKFASHNCLYGYNEFEHTTSHSSKMHLVENEADTLYKPNACFKQLYSDDQLDMLSTSTNQYESSETAFSQLQHSVPITDGDLDYTPINNSNLPLKIAKENAQSRSKQFSGTQLYGCLRRQLANSFATVTKKLPTFVRAPQDKDYPFLNPVDQLNGNVTGYLQKLCNVKHSLPKYESNGHYNMDSTYSTPQSYSPASTAYDEKANFATKNGVSSYNNTTSIDKHTFFDASFGQFQSISANVKDTAFPYVDEPATEVNNKNFYNAMNGFHDPNVMTAPTGKSRTEFQKPDCPKNKSTYITSDAYVTPFGLSAKRLKTGEIQQDIKKNCNASSKSDFQELFLEIDLNNGVGCYSEEISTESLVSEFSGAQNDSKNVDFNRDLCNELEMFFKQLPLSTCTSQSQLSFTLAQSTGCDQPQLKIPPRNFPI